MTHDERRWIRRPEGLRLRTLCALALAGAVVSAAGEQGPEMVPTAGMVIDKPVRFKPGTYRLAAPKNGPLITIRGDGVRLDFAGVRFEGGDPIGDPDQYTGTGILVDGAKNVTIENLTIRGYKVGIHGRRATGLKITHNDLSYNWKPRLWSGIERESLADWLSYHNNEKDEWLRYGAAIYLSESDAAEVDHNIAVQGQNGLLVTRSTGLKIWNNTFSWMSGLGIGFYRTSESQIVANKLDWNVRGYSHGFYNRGQDSAALLMYEQSGKNIVMGNSATHSGDGLFLWAGQSTMDTGKGGANDNLFQDNDFSHAVANGIEATFSRNRFIANRIDDCWHGVWGGYSYDSQFIGNTFAGNDEAIAIEHGQNITITGNRFRGDGTAIRIWANPSQDPNWGYVKARDTRSHEYLITQNEFIASKTAVSLTRTTNVKVESNIYATVGVPITTGGDVRAVTFEPAVPRPGPVQVPPAPAFAGAMDAKLPDNARRGRVTIIVDEWGPYDFRSPKLWPVGKPTDRPLTLRVMGPPGKWTVKSVRGGATTARDGTVPADIPIAINDRALDLDVLLEYVGEQVVTSRGVVVPAGKPVPVIYRLYEPTVDWTVKYWAFEPPQDPVQFPQNFTAKLKEAPIKTEILPRLDFTTGGAIGASLPANRVALRAEGIVQLPQGLFELAVISDDGVRVWIDDRLVIDRWNVHESEIDRLPLTGGRYKMKIEYFENTGWAELQVRFIKR
jgi:nitrous oxidase accessory protein NosD